MSSRIQRCFTALKNNQRSGLVTFITAGDPSAAATLANMHALVRGGADLIELGVPFSDPMADGPTIQRASERALSAGMSLRNVLEIVLEFRLQNSTTPVVLMGYLNPIECFGYREFSLRAAEAGVDGVLTVDLPPEEAEDLNRELRAAGLDSIYLIAPTSNVDRIRAVCAQASGFVYYVSVKGVTGDKTFALDDVQRQIAGIKAHTELPVGVGFGIRSPAHAATLAAVSDAIIVGSALVEIIEREQASIPAMTQALESFVASLRTALDAQRVS
jgi:tryptophan synthase alpha chain